MEVLTATVGQMLVLFLLILIGYLLARCKAVPENTATVLSKLENSLFVPALVLGTFIENFTVDKIAAAGSLFAVSFVVCIAMMLLAVLAARCCTKDPYIRKIYTYGLAFSNFGFMGNAVVNAVFPGYFVDYLIFTMPLWTMIYLWGVPCLLIPQEGKTGVKDRLKSFCNPMFICLIIGMAIGVLRWELPAFVRTAINVTGSCMSPVAMLLTGITVAQMDLKKVLSIKSIYAVSLIRLVLFPMAALGLLWVLRLPEAMTVCILCSLAMPLGLSTIVIPRAYGKDTSVAAGMTIISHLLAVITIPAIFYLMMKTL